MSPRVVVKSEVRAKLLASAGSIAASQGWAAVTVRKVADKLGYSQAVVYEYFQSKNGLMAALVEEGFQLLYRNLKAAYDSTVAPPKRIAAMAQAYWQMSVDHPELYQIMFGLQGATCDQEIDVPEAEQAIALTQTAVAELIQLSGRQDDPYMAFLQLWSLLHGLVALNMAGILEKKTPSHKALNYVVDSYIRSYAGGKH